MNTSALDNYIGQPVEVEDASALDQCMDLAFLWCDLIGIPRSAIRNGYAYQVWGNHDPNYLDVVTGTPQPGDFAIWGTQVGFAGHIAIVKSGNFTSYDQNWNYIQKVEVVPHTYYGVLGFLRPKNYKGDNVTNFTPEQVNILMQVAQNRPATEDEKAVYPGRDATEVLQSILDSDGSKTFRTEASNFEKVQAALDVANASNAQLNDLNQQLKKQVAQYQAQPQTSPTPPAPAPQPSVSPSASNNSITITKDGLWAKVKAFLKWLLG